jgi:hypothetical protein
MTSQDNIDDSVGNDSNVQKVVFVESKFVMLACVIAALALGLVIANMVQQPQITDAKIDARMAELRAEMADRNAEAKAIATSGKQDARIALDKVEQTQVQLGAKGIVFPSTH